MNAMKRVFCLLAALVLCTGTAQAGISGIRYTSYSPGGAVQNTDTVLVDRGGNSNVRIAFPDIATYATSHISGTANAFAAYSSAGLLTSIPTDCSLTTIGGSAAASTCPDFSFTSTPTAAICGRIMPYTLPSAVTVTLPSASSPGMTQGCEFDIYAISTAGTVTIASTGSTIDSKSSITVRSGTGIWLRSDGSNWKADLAASTAITNDLARIAPVGAAGQIFFNSGGTQVSALTISGDAVLYTSSGALTLNTVNATAGTFGSVSSIPTFTVNGKGQITYASSGALTASSLAGTTLASNVVSSSLTSLGTVTSGVWNGSALGVGYGGTGLTSAPANGALDIGNGIGFTRGTLTAGSGINIVNTVGAITISATSAGTVTSASVASANGFAGTVATSTTTPAITLSTTVTGLLKGNGTALSAASAGADYVAPNATVNARTGSYTFALADNGAYAVFSSASNLTATIPSHSSVAFSNGAQLPFAMWGSGTMTVSPSAGVSLRYASGLTFTSAAGYAIQTSQDSWDVIGGK